MFGEILYPEIVFISPKSILNPLSLPFVVHLIGMRFSLHGAAVVYEFDVTTSVVVDLVKIGVVVSFNPDDVDPEDCPILVVVPDGVDMVVEMNVVPFVCFNDVPTVVGLVKHPFSSSWFLHCALPSHTILLKGKQTSSLQRKPEHTVVPVGITVERIVVVVGLV